MTQCLLSNPPEFIKRNSDKLNLSWQPPKPKNQRKQRRNNPNRNKLNINNNKRTLKNVDLLITPQNQPDLRTITPTTPTTPTTTTTTTEEFPLHYFVKL